MCTKGQTDSVTTGSLLLSMSYFILSYTYVLSYKPGKYGLVNAQTV